MSCCDRSRPGRIYLGTPRPRRHAAASPCLRLRVDCARRTPRRTRSGSGFGLLDTHWEAAREPPELARGRRCPSAPICESRTVPRGPSLVQGQSPFDDPSRNGRRHGPVWAKHRGRHTRRRPRQCAVRKRQDMPESTLEWVRATFDPETVSYKNRCQVAEELGAKRQSAKGRLPRRYATNRSRGTTVTRVPCPRAR
jgi:hypothetical protein